MVEGNKDSLIKPRLHTYGVFYCSFGYQKTVYNPQEKICEFNGKEKETGSSRKLIFRRNA